MINCPGLPIFKVVLRSRFRSPRKPSSRNEISLACKSLVTAIEVIRLILQRHNLAQTKRIFPNGSPKNSPHGYEHMGQLLGAKVKQRRLNDKENHRAQQRMTGRHICLLEYIFVYLCYLCLYICSISVCSAYHPKFSISSQI